MSEEVEGTRTSEEQQEMEDKVISPEKAEEAKLKARYPNLGAKPGGSDLLRKRLQKGPKYFDSGDYNMAKAKMKNKQLPSAPTEKTEITGGHIPTPQDLPQRKTSIVASKLAGWWFYVYCFVTIPAPNSYLPAFYVFVLFCFFAFVCILYEQVMYQAKKLSPAGTELSVS